MKWIGIILVVLASWLLSAFWHDPVEGELLRPLAFLGIIAGIVLFFEGLKRDIVAAITADTDVIGSRLKRQSSEPPETPGT